MILENGGPILRVGARDRNTKKTTYPELVKTTKAASSETAFVVYFKKSILFKSVDRVYREIGKNQSSAYSCPI